MLRIQAVEVLRDSEVRLTLTNGQSVVRNLSSLLRGEVFRSLMENPGLFSEVRAEGGTLVWPNGADLCPDVLIWGGPPPLDGTTPPPAWLAPAA